jgi:hypothetical protein
MSAQEENTKMALLGNCKTPQANFRFYLLSSFIHPSWNLSWRRRRDPMAYDGFLASIVERGCSRRGVHVVAGPSTHPAHGDGSAFATLPSFIHYISGTMWQRCYGSQECGSQLSLVQKKIAEKR